MLTQARPRQDRERSSVTDGRPGRARIVVAVAERHYELLDTGTEVNDRLEECAQVNERVVG